MENFQCIMCGTKKNYLCHRDGNVFCHFCWDLQTREEGVRNHEDQEWNDRLDRIKNNTASIEEKTVYGVQ